MYSFITIILLVVNRCGEKRFWGRVNLVRVILNILFDYRFLKRLLICESPKICIKCCSNFFVHELLFSRNILRWIFLSVLLCMLLYYEPLSVLFRFFHSLFFTWRKKLGMSVQKFVCMCVYSDILSYQINMTISSHT